MNRAHRQMMMMDSAKRRVFVVPAPRFNFGAAQYDSLTGLYTLPSWLAIACATTGRSSRVTTTTVKSGYGANAARGRDVGSGVGLSVEQACTSVATLPSALNNWALQTGTVITADQAVAPDGTTTADLVDLTACGYGIGVFPSSGTCVTGVVYAASIWLRAVSGTTSVTISNAQTAQSNPVCNLTTTWQLFYLPGEPAPSTFPWATWIRKNAAQGVACQLYGWGQQYATGKIPGSYTYGVKSPRAADVLTCATPATVAPGGYFNIDMTFAPNYAKTEQVADHDLVYFDTNNRLFLQQSTAKLVLRLGGADVLSSALTWSRETGIRVQATHYGGGRRLIVSGATTGNGDSGLQSAAPAITLPAAVGFLGNGTTTQESADLRDLTI